MLQCFMIIKEKAYTKLVLLSIILSFYCTGIPFFEFIDRRLREISVIDLTFIERFTVGVLWATDIFIRTLLILYMLVSDSEGAGIVIAVVWLVGMTCLTYVFPWGEGKGTLSMLGSFLFVFLCVGLLIISSLSKGQIASSLMRGLETCFRFVISIVVAGTLYQRGEIHLWQLIVFLFMALMFGCLQFYLYIHLQLDDDLQYSGHRINLGNCRDKCAEVSLICSENDRVAKADEDLELVEGLGRAIKP